MRSCGGLSTIRTVAPGVILFRTSQAPLVMSIRDRGVTGLIWAPLTPMDQWCPTIGWMSKPLLGGVVGGHRITAWYSL